jgi:hypothetical protein
MAGFMGGSAYSMSRDIAGGFIQVTDRTLRSMTIGELNQLAHEIERYLRELRGSQVVTEDITETQTRARKIQRLNSAMMVIRNRRQNTRR